MKNILILALFLMVISTSCEDFLNRKPTDRLSTESFFKNKKDLEVALNAVYHEIGFNSWNRDYGKGTDMLRIEALTDNALDHHSWNAGYRLADGTASTDDGYSTYRWKQRYQGIQRVNRIFESVEGITDIDPAYKKRLLAEAAFLRAYFYFDLVYLFGDVPFLTTSIKPEDVEPIGDQAAELAKRTDKTEILGALLTDLQAIEDALPIQYEDQNKGRVTRGAAYFLKSKIYLYQKKYDAAAKAAKDVMDLNTYALYPAYKNLFTYEGIGNQEVIFDIQVVQDVDLGEFYTQNFGPNSVGGWSSSCPLQSLVDAYECTDGLSINDSPLFDPNNPYANRDPRLAYSILFPGTEWRGGVYNSIPGASYPGGVIVPGDDLTDGTAGDWNKTATGYNWLKYMSNKDVDESNYWDGGVHFILMRYAEVLLTYAEAKIEANQIDPTVLDAINEVRSRGDVGMPAIPIGLSQDELREVVRNERRVEFAFEGIRLFDIRRWEIAEHVMPGVPKGLTYQDGGGNAVTFEWSERIFNANKHYWWPIPQSEIDVTKIDQNPNW